MTPTPNPLPISEHILLKDHTKGITALDVDHAGVRVASGGLDTAVCLWDFTGMDARLRPFRRVEPVPGAALADVRWSPSGDQLLAASSSTQTNTVKILTREAGEVASTTNGDRYLRDLRLTKGHVGAVTGVRWHPFTRGQFVSSALDSTIRVWQLGRDVAQTRVIVVKSGTRQQRTHVTCCSISGSGKLVAGGSLDGSIKLYSLSGASSAVAQKPALAVEEAHGIGAEIGSLEFCVRQPDVLVSRASDDTCKLWDLRRLDGPVATTGGLPCRSGLTNAVFAGDDERVLVTGTAPVPKAPAGSPDATGSVVVLDAATLERRATTALDAGRAAVRVAWHPRLRQLLVGDSLGAVTVFYDPDVSERGALLCADRRVSTSKLRDEALASATRDSVNGVVGQIVTPFEAGGRQTARKRPAENPDDEAQPSKPQPRQHGVGGKIAVTPLQHFMKDYVERVSVQLREDPREAILRHAQAAAETPMWVAPAYKDTQPAVYSGTAVAADDAPEDDGGIDDDEEAELARLRRAKRLRDARAGRSSG